MGRLVTVRVSYETSYCTFSNNKHIITKRHSVRNTSACSPSQELNLMNVFSFMIPFDFYSHLVPTGRTLEYIFAIYQHIVPKGRAPMRLCNDKCYLGRVNSNSL